MESPSKFSKKRVKVGSHNYFPLQRDKPLINRNHVESKI
jgi:hypothetical protein